MAKILIVEDDQVLADLAREWLGFEHHTVDVVGDGTEGLDRVKHYEYDLIVLDWQLPGISGLEILREFRASGGTAPVLMLTGRGTVSDKETGLDSGADDYLTKPFHAKELCARVRALLRRQRGYLGNVVQVGDLVLDRMSYKVTRGGEEVKLVPKEFALLEFLMRNPNRVFSPEHLLNSVWPTESDATVDALTTCIKRLRKKIDVEDKPSIIQTVYGVGYKLEAK
ncbi:MAG TPA: response regulator transcription factor [Candidatus Obscuribacterales bacterium]